MFEFLKKKKDENIYAPVKGKCIDITEVDDAGFSSKVMGDGIAIIPEEDVIYAPADGTLSMMFATGHAFGIVADNGAEILVHIGIDTVNLNGDGFRTMKKAGEHVRKGEAIVKIDLAKMKESYDMSTMVIITNEKKFKKLALQTMVGIDTPILEGIA